VVGRVVASIVGILVVLAMGVGCGGGDDDSSLSKAEFVKQADEVCTRAESKKNKDLEAAFQQLGKEGKSGKQAEEELVTGTALPPISEMTEELKDLGAPSGEEDQVDAMISAFEEEVEKVEGDPASVINGSGGEFNKANQLAKEMGLEACSQI
jgi:hypothetical protein